MISPGGGCALPGLQAPLTGSHPVGPRKRSAAGRWHQARSCVYAGWRLRLTRPTGASHRLTPRRPGKRSATGETYRHAGRTTETQKAHPAGWALHLFDAWQFPTLTWGDPTLPSALRRFTSEFGMGSGGTTALVPPGKFCFINTSHQRID